MPLPTNRTIADTIEEHLDDHNTLNAQHNELEGHAADTTAVHGIADTAALALSSHDHDADYEPIGAAAAAAAALVDAAPGTLDTLNELAAALGDDANFATTVTTALAGKSATTHNHDAAYEATGAVATHTGDTSAAHAASAVAFTPTGTVSATDVQAAIAEVDSEKATTGHTHTGTYEPSGTVATHAAAADPHTGYLQESVISGLAAPAVVLGSAAAAGSATTVIRSDSTIAAFDATSPTTQAFGDAAAVGTAAFAARRDHKHAMPADPVTAHTAAADPHTGYVLESLIDAAGDLIVGTANDTVGRLAMGSALQVLRVNSGATALEFAAASGGGGNAIYGDGSDGVVNFDGTTARLGLTPSSGVYTLNRDIFLADGSQVSGTAVIKAVGYRIYCQGTLTVGASAVIHNDGDDASGATGGASAGNGTLGSGNSTGGTGGTGPAVGGNATGSRSNSYGAAGRTGGISGQGNAGGNGQTVTAPSGNAGTPRANVSLPGTIQGASGVTLITGGSAGGGGGAAASSTGGGGGGGSGVVAVLAKGIVNSGAIRAKGGNGAAASGTNAGGGGGGGGGVVILIYNTFSGNAASVAGGSGGAGVGTGATPSAAPVGTVFTIVNA